MHVRVCVYVGVCDVLFSHSYSPSLPCLSFRPQTESLNEREKSGVHGMSTREKLY